MKSRASQATESTTGDSSVCETDCEKEQLPQEALSNDPEVLRAALIRESGERRRADCLARMQAGVAQLALDLLVREPDVQGFFGALTKTMVEEAESNTCAVWLVDEDHSRCELWMAYVVDRLYMLPIGGSEPQDADCGDGHAFPCNSMATHLFTYRPGWAETVRYSGDDPRLPQAIREFNRDEGVDNLVVAPMLLGNRTLGWMALCSEQVSQYEWWRVVLIEAIARQAALALHHNRLAEANRREERRQAVLEERNRFARDIHDNLAQGFAAILMQLQGAQREARNLPGPLAVSIETAVELARTHLSEARRSVGALRPNVGTGEDIGAAIKRLADLGQRTTSVPIDVIVDELPRLGDGVEREIIRIAQEALTNAVRHSKARRITIRASTVQSVGLRLSVADDGRGIARDRPTTGFGMTSMQERAERIGASLTIVTAPRNGTEVVLAWDPSTLPTQVHVAN